MSLRISDVEGIARKVIKASNERLGAQLDGLCGDVKAWMDRRDGDIDMMKDAIEDWQSRQGQPGRTWQEGSLAYQKKALLKCIATGDASDLQTKDMSIVAGAAAGGAMVPEQIADGIFARAIAESGLANLVTVTNTNTSDYVRILNLRGATGAWSSETGSRSGTSTPLLREIRPTHGELYALPTVTRWLVQDSKFDIDRFLNDNVTAVFSKSIELAVLSGTGSSQPTGILNSTPVLTVDGASPERDQDTIQYIAGTADLAGDLVDLYFTLKPEYRRRATFVMSSIALSSVRKLRAVSGDGGWLWQQNLAAPMDAPDGLLVGRPVVTSDYLGALGSSPTDFTILCGDFAQAYELVRIGPMVMIRDEVTVKGKISLYFAQRIGGRLVDNDAVKVLKA